MRESLLIPAIRLIRRLWKDESGVVLGVVMVVMLTLYAMAAALFALGEQVRDRIELQNAVDAAAYSAAVVQADTISRIAAINQAMAWTYVQMIRRHMDAIMGRWLERVIQEFRKSEQNLWDFYNSRYSAYAMCDFWTSKNWGIGYPTAPGGGGGNKIIRFNKHLNMTIYEVENTLASMTNYKALENEINDIIEPLLEAMAVAEESLFSSLKQNMVAAAENVLRRNGITGDNDWITVVTAEAQNYFHVYGSSNEGRDGHKGEPEFLRTIKTDGSIAFGPGSCDNEWFLLQKEQPWRKYVQRGNMLTVEYYGFAEGYRSRRYHGGEYGCHQYHGVGWQSKSVSRRLYGSDSGPFLPVAKIRPHRLSCLFFDGDVRSNGGVIVAAARKIRNPFGSIVKDGSKGDFYDMIGNGNGRLMVAAAAARAGFRDEGRRAPDGNTAGVYSPYSDSHQIVWHGEFLPRTDEKEAKAREMWQDRGWAGMSNNNLGETDWDAVMVPLNRVWTKRVNSWQNRSDVAAYGGQGPFKAGRWANNSTGATVLNYLWHNARWRNASRGQELTGLESAGILPGSPREADLVSSRSAEKRFGSSTSDLAKSLMH